MHIQQHFIDGLCYSDVARRSTPMPLCPLNVLGYTYKIYNHNCAFTPSLSYLLIYLLILLLIYLRSIWPLIQLETEDR